jgi:hypothetical protein
LTNTRGAAVKICFRQPLKQKLLNSICRAPRIRIQASDSAPSCTRRLIYPGTLNVLLGARTLPDGTERIPVAREQ